MNKELKGANRVTGKKLYGISKEEIISDVLDVYRDNGNRLTREEYLSKGKFSRAPIKRLFGGWNALLKDLNLNINCSRMDATCDDVVADLASVMSCHNEINAKIYRKHGKYSQAIVDRLFGSYTNLVASAGLPPLYPGVGMPKQQIIKGLKALYDKHGFINSTLIDTDFYISLPTVYSKVGHMDVIYQELDIDPPSSSAPGNAVVNLISKIIKEKPIKEWTCPQLKNPKTGMSLFIDGYFPDSQIAIEYDGVQHYEFTPHFHKDISSFRYQQSLDRFKDAVMDTMGINMIRIRYDESVDKNSLEKKLSNKNA